jgi:hypothetical protein
MTVKPDFPLAAVLRGESFSWNRFRCHQIWPGRWAIGRGRGSCGTIFERDDGTFLVVDRNGQTLRDHVETFELALRAFG